MNTEDLNLLAARIVSAVVDEIETTDVSASKAAEIVKLAAAKVTRILSESLDRLETGPLLEALACLLVPYLEAKKSGLPSGVYVQRARFELAEKAMSPAFPHVTVTTVDVSKSIETEALEQVTRLKEHCRRHGLPLLVLVGLVESQQMIRAWTDQEHGTSREIFRQMAHELLSSNTN